MRTRRIKTNEIFKKIQILIVSFWHRYCSKEAKFTIKEVDIGICADLGTVQVSFDYFTNYLEYFLHSLMI